MSAISAEICCNAACDASCAVVNIVDEEALLPACISACLEECAEVYEANAGVGEAGLALLGVGSFEELICNALTTLVMNGVAPVLAPFIGASVDAIRGVCLTALGVCVAPAA